MRGKILEQKICNKLSSVPTGRGLFEDCEDKDIVPALIENKVYGGFEGKLEDGELVHFKYWVSKKK